MRERGKDEGEENAPVYSGAPSVEHIHKTTQLNLGFWRGTSKREGEPSGSKSTNSQLYINGCGDDDDDDDHDDGGGKLTARQSGFCRCSFCSFLWF